MTRGRGPAALALAATIWFLAAAPAPAGAAAARTAAGRDAVSGPTRFDASAGSDSSGMRRRVLPVHKLAAGAAPAAGQRRAAAARAAGVSGNVLVSLPLTTSAFSETAVAADPNDATGQHLTASSNLLTAAGMPVMETTNGGLSWTQTALLPLNFPAGYAFFSDPGVAFDTAGIGGNHAFFSFIGVDTQFNTDLEVARKLPTGGFGLSIPDGKQSEPDKPMIATDPRGGNGSVYVAYDTNDPAVAGQPLVVVGSHDDGQSYGLPAFVWNSGGDTAAWPAVAGDGTVYVVWDDYCGATPATVASLTACPNPKGQILVSRSTDGGATWPTQPVPISATTTGFGSILPNYAPECTAGCPARPVNSSPQIAIDHSGGPRDGTLYVVYGDGSDRQVGAATVPSAGRMHVFLQESKDGGAHWSNRVQLDAGNPNDAWQPSVAVDQSSGDVVTSWYDRRDDPDNHLYRTYLAQSTADSGGVAAFTGPIPAADTMSDPTTDCNGTGDYQQIAAAAGVAHPVWTDMRTGLPAVFTAAVTESAVAVPSPLPAPSPVPPGHSVRSAAGTAWLALPGGARDIGVGADCQAWIIGQNPIQGGGETWFWGGPARGWVAYSGGGVRITVHPAGLPRLVNDGGGIYRLLSSGVWQQLPGAGTDIASGPDSSLWLIGADGITGGHGVYVFNGSGFVFESGGGVRIAVGPDGLPWVVNNVGAIWHLTRSGWTFVPGGGHDIAVGADGSVWLLGLNTIAGGFQTYRYNGSGWDAVNGGGVAIAVGPDGMPWVVNSAGAIYERV